MLTTQKKIVHAAKANKTGDFVTDDELLDLFEAAKVIDTQNKVKFNMDDFVNYYKLPRQKLSYDGMNGINYFLDYYMRKYPTKTYVDWARTDVKINPYNKEFYVPDIDGDIRRCEAVRNQMYYDLRDIKDQGISLNPAYIKQLQEQAEQLNDIYQDLINRRATIGFLNGRPISRELYEAPVRFSNFLKQYGK